MQCVSNHNTSDCWNYQPAYGTVRKRDSEALSKPESWTDLTLEHISLDQNFHLFLIICFVLLSQKSSFSSLQLNPVPKYVILFPFFTRLCSLERNLPCTLLSSQIYLPNLYLIFLFPLYSKLLPREIIPKFIEQLLCVRYWAKQLKWNISFISRNTFK